MLCLFAGPAVSATKRTTGKAKASSTKRTAAAKSKGKKKATRTRARSTRPARQQTPTPERYREIQQALADQGYYKGEIDGNWDAECVAALKEFQLEQNLNPDGKLGALSIIALGLGPKYEASALVMPEPSSESDQ